MSLARPIRSTIEKNGCFAYFEDGIIVISAGKISALGSAATILPTLAYDVEVRDCRGKFIMPGFIDTHIHYAQTDIIAAYAAVVAGLFDQIRFGQRAEKGLDHGSA